MKAALEKIREVEKNLVAIQELKEQLQNKSADLSYQRSMISNKIDQAEGRLKDALLENVKGNLTDSELSDIRSEISELKMTLRDLSEKSEALTVLKKNAEADEQRLIKSRPTVRLSFLRAAFDDLFRSIPDEVREMIKQAWAIRSRMPGGDYEKMLRELFPQEHVAGRDERWLAFTLKHGVNH